MKCKQCIHYDVCEIDYFDGYPDGCQHFKNKEDWIQVSQKPQLQIDVKHGYWKHTIESFGQTDVDCIECSMCGESWAISDELSFGEQISKINFCPNCGARVVMVRSEKALV